MFRLDWLIDLIDWRCGLVLRNCICAYQKPNQISVYTNGTMRYDSYLLSSQRILNVPPTSLIILITNCYVLQYCIRILWILPLTFSYHTGKSSDPYRILPDKFGSFRLSVRRPLTRGREPTSEGGDVLLTFSLFQKDKSGPGTVLGTWTGSSGRCRFDFFIFRCQNTKILRN